MNETLKTQIEEHCQMVQRGAKPCSLLTIKTEYNHSLVDRIYDEYNLHAISKRSNETFSELWIFKNNSLRFIIDLLPDEPTTPLDHALLGYLFGYDTDSICDYILKHCQLNEPNLM